MKMIVDIAHDFLSEVLKPSSIAVDFTMGNGFDTLFLCERCKKVYAFDKQQKALENTKERLQNNHLENYELILDGHEHCRRYLPIYQVGIFNLGYLPGQSHVITTKEDTTLKALRDAIDLLDIKGRLVVVCYPGHDEGKKESEAIERFASCLSSHDFHVASFKMMNKKLSPYLVIIDKVH
jgi:16S rRNA C1402 N4-methylase RsmH